MAPPLVSTHVDQVLGLQDFFKPEIWRAAAMEFAATLTLMFMSISATISILEQGYSSPIIALAIIQGAILSFCILGAAPASGGHLNPLITVATMLTGYSSPVQTILYVTCQALGSICASFVVKTMVGIEIAQQYNLGGCVLRKTPSTGLANGPGFLAEIGFSFVVLFIVFGVAVDPKLKLVPGIPSLPFIVGAAVGMCIYVSAGLLPGYLGAGLNPGRCIGPAVALGGSLWHGHWVFWAGPFTAALAFACVFHLVPPNHVELYRDKRDMISGARRFITSSSSLKVDSCGNGL